MSLSLVASTGRRVFRASPPRNEGHRSRPGTSTDDATASRHNNLAPQYDRRDGRRRNARHSSPTVRMSATPPSSNVRAPSSRARTTWQLGEDDQSKGVESTEPCLSDCPSRTAVDRKSTRLNYSH